MACFDGSEARAAAQSSDAGALGATTGEATEERPGEGLFLLPGGYLDERGRLHREVRLAPLTGRDEEYLALGAPGDATASAVTGLLARCLARVGSVERVDAALVRELLVCDREYLVLRLRALTFGPEVEAVLKCGGRECGQPMDVQFSLDDLQVERRAVGSRFFTAHLSSPVFVERGGAREETRHVEFRLPTGADQEALAAVFRADEARALRLLLARTIRRVGTLTEVDEELVAGLPMSALEEIAGQMRLLSPQIEIELDGACPECGTPFSTRFDGVGFFASEVVGNLYGLELEVHLLAWHYHWSEQDILSMTRQKRRRYVNLLRGVLESQN